MAEKNRIRLNVGQKLNRASIKNNTAIITTASVSQDPKHIIVQGAGGLKGETGPANTLTIGTVESGATADATITGAAPNQTLNLVLPKGEQGPEGPTGPANTLSIGTVEKGETAGATITGTAPNQTLNLTLPKGDTGEQGPQGPAATIAAGNTTTLPAGSSATVTNSGTSSAAVFDFGIPKGDKGDAATVSVGATTTLDPGSSATVTNSGTSSAAVFNFGIPKGDPADQPEPSKTATPGTTIELTDAGPSIKALNKIDGNTTQQTYSGVQLLVGKGYGTPTSNTTFWNFTTGITNLTFHTDGWVDYTTNAPSFTPLYAKMAAVGSTYEAGAKYTVLVEWKDAPSGAWRLGLSSGQIADNPFVESLTLDVNTTSGSSKNVFTAKSGVSSSDLALRLWYQNSNTSSPASFSLRVMIAKGDYSQDDTFAWQPNLSPSPDFPQNVNVVTGEQTITISDGNSQSQSYSINLGKNLYVNSQDFSGTWNNASGWTTSAETYNGLVVKERSASWNGISQTLNVEKGKTYTFSLYAKAGSTRQCSLYFLGGTATASMSEAYITFTATTEWQRYSITSTCTASGTVQPRLENRTDETTPTSICGYQLEENSTATTYAPYFTPIELCKIGTYQDYIYKSGSDWYIHKEVGKVVIDGSQSVTSYGTATTGKYRYSVPATGAANVATDVVANVSDKFVGVSRSDTYNNVNGMYQATGLVGFYWDAISSYTTAQVQTWLSSNNVTAYYVLATATDTKITDATLISELNSVDTAALYEGECTITNTSTNLPGVLYLDYWTWFKGEKGPAGPSGSGAWGTITGDIQTQTDLQNEFATKANISSLATVATSGSYTDLSDKPTIPTVNNATLTIQKNGTNVQTFTANSSTNATANITVPTALSELTGTVSTSQIANAAVTSAKLDYSTINLGTLSQDVVIGTYLGKTLYLRVEYFTMPADTTGWKQFTFSSTLDLGIPKNVYGMGHSSAGTSWVNMNRSRPENPNYAMGISTLYNDKIDIAIGSSMANYIDYFYICIEYTKADPAPPVP